MNDRRSTLPDPTPGGAPGEAAFLTAVRDALDEAPVDGTVREGLARARRAAVARAEARRGPRGGRLPGPLAAWIAGPIAATTAVLLVLMGPGPGSPAPDLRSGAPAVAAGGAPAEAPAVPGGAGAPEVLPADLGPRELAALADLEFLEQMDFVAWLDAELEPGSGAG